MWPEPQHISSYCALCEGFKCLSLISLWCIWNMQWFSEQSCIDKIICFILIGRVVYT